MVEFDYEDETAYLYCPLGEEATCIVLTEDNEVKVDRFIDDMWLTEEVVKWLRPQQPKDK